LAETQILFDSLMQEYFGYRRYGWYRYDVRFALPVYEESVLVRYNVFGARLLINHAENGKKYLYDILAIKKETSKP